MGRFIVSCLLVVLILPSSAFCQNGTGGERQKALSTLRPGKPIRIACEPLGCISGRFILNRNDTLHLGIDKSSGSAELSGRRARKKRVISLFGKAIKWKAVEEETLIPHSLIRELRVRSRATALGALIGGVLGGGIAFGIGAAFKGIDDSNGDSSSDQIRLTAVGILAGGFVGGLIGTMIPKWSLRYREPGFMARIEILPEGQPHSVRGHLVVQCEYRF